MDIVDAIKAKKLLQFTYHGFLRTVEPHTYGVSKDGERMLCAFQVAGGSRSSPGGWRMFAEKDIDGVSILDKRFSNPRPEYQKGDGFFKSIIAEL